MEKTLYISWHLADPGILLNWIQFAAAKGKTDYVGLLLDHGYNNWQFDTEPKNVPVFDLYQLEHWELPLILVLFYVLKSDSRLCLVSLMSLSHRLDLESHREGTPRAIELAAINGHVDAFSLLAARLQMDSQNNEWFQLGQVRSLSSNHLLSLSLLFLSSFSLSLLSVGTGGISSHPTILPAVGLRRGRKR